MVDQLIVKELRSGFPKSSRRELSRSDFERVFESPFGNENGQILNEQYRMDDVICRLVSKTFYEPHRVRLRTSDDRKGRRDPSNLIHSLKSESEIWKSTRKMAVRMQLTFR